jgi:trigger factor
MKVTQEKLPASQIGLEIEITPEMSQQAYEKALQEFTRFANIPGFRKGKVPRQVLIQRYGSTRIKATVVEDLIQSSLQKAIEQEEIAAIGNPNLQSSFDELVEKFQPGAALTFSAAVDVVPEVVLKQYKDLQVQAEEFTYDPEQVGKVLEDYRKRSATLVPVEDRPAQQGDIATVDFAGRLTPEPESGAADSAGETGEPQSLEIPGGSAEDFEIELAEGRFIPGFIDGIIGMQLGETKEVAVTFPEDYPQPDLAGKPAVFTITVKELKERELPDLDDDFAQEVSEFETLAELRESLESRFQKEAEQKTKESKQEALLKQLLEQLEADLPETLIRREVDQAVTQTAMQFSQQGMDIRKTFTQEVVAMLREQARPEAVVRLKRTLALGEIAKQESIQVSPDEVQAKAEELLAEYGGQDEIDPDRLREVVQEDLLREKILDWLESHNSIELVPEGSLQPAEEPEVAELVEAEPVASEPETIAATTDAIEVEARLVEDEAEEAAPEIVSEAATATVDGEAKPAAESTDASSETPSQSAKSGGSTKSGKAESKKNKK